ncbi:MAG: type II secretion system protein GspM [Methylocella sp.]
MISATSLIKRFDEPYALATLGYLAVVLTLLTISWFALSGLKDDYDEFSVVNARLAAMEGHGKSGDQAAADDSPFSGSPFLDGPTVTIAGADLQRRVVAAVDKVGGNVLSSQIDLHDVRASEGYVTLSATCEVDQTALQPLLYDLEAGMPFLFIEQIIIQGSQSGAQKEGGRMHVQIDVTGQWEVTK